MRPQLVPGLFLALLVAAPAGAQTAARPLNLKLPPDGVPAMASTTPMPASAPGVYYGDTSGRTTADGATIADACDDATFNQPQVHGRVGMGVMSGSHVEGSYQQGTVHLDKAFGDCAHPGGGISVTIEAGTGHVRGRRP